jgi:tetratricopeptide (TPR) repeat protein
VAISGAFAAEPALYELQGRLMPSFGARVTLFGTAEPFSATTIADLSGRFRFKKLEPGLYTLSVYSRRRGEARRTIDIGPARADQKRRVLLELKLSDADFAFAAAMNRQLIAAGQLAVPDAARRDYDEAQKDLARRDVAGAIARLEHAVKRAPQFSAAWNSLGVIAYQTRKFDRAEECFRKAVETDPESFESLVNLGGVTLTLRKLDDAMQYNLQAVLKRPNDALANAQLGVTYYTLGQFELAAKYLEHTRRLDPASFTYPQLLLFRIHYQGGDRRRAAADLEDFLTQHPDWPQASSVRETITRLRITGKNE